jgi:general secretion pathway protein D
MENRTKVVGGTMTVAVALLATVFLTPGLLTTTTVTVVPQAGTFYVGNTFDVTIQCVPSRPVKAFEFRVLFDQNIIHPLKVSEGSIFVGKPTFFSPGTIDNGTGKIISIYNLIVGHGNVTSAGSLVVIKFVAVGRGTSTIKLEKLGLTNETLYIPVQLTNGSITISGDVSPPSISFFTWRHSQPLDSHSNWYNLSCDVTDDRGVHFVNLTLLSPQTDNQYDYQMHKSGNHYYYNVSLNEAGGWWYNITATDISGNPSYIQGVIVVTPNVDINEDGVVNLLDIIRVANHYGEIGAPGWIKEDVDNNGKVQVLDMSWVSSNWG